MLDAALAGERQFFAAEYDHPTRGARRGADRIYAVERRATARSRGIVMRHQRRHRAARRRARAARKRGAVPADRQFGAGDDVGDPARPHPRLRQRRLCRVRRAGRTATARRRGRSTGARGSIPTTSTGSSPRASPARRRCSASRSRGATCATTANIAGCAACRSRASGRTGSWSGSSASAATSPSPRRPSSSFGGRSRSGPAQLAASEAQFRAVFEAALEVMVLLEARRHRARGQQPARGVAPPGSDRGDRQEDVGRADAAAPIRSISRR